VGVPPSRFQRFSALQRVSQSRPPSGRAIWPISGKLAELEHSLISELTRGGVKGLTRALVRVSQLSAIPPLESMPLAEAAGKGVTVINHSDRENLP
jgi:hypothetical protein